MKHSNRLRFPPRASDSFNAGWVACESGATLVDCPYEWHTTERAEWLAGFARRGDRGFRVDHLPRKPSGAFA